MCGRYYTEVDREEMQNIIDAVNRVMTGSEALPQMKTGEVFPTNIAPVYVNSPSGATPALMKWGFPGYPKPGTVTRPSPIINARSETIADKPTFNRYLNKRCLVPANMYFEWAKVVVKGEKKPKYSFRPIDSNLSLFWMAAIYRHVENEKVPAFTILTMDASPSIAPIHDRMPVILGSKEARRAWMGGESDLHGLFEDTAVREFAYEPSA